MSDNSRFNNCIHVFNVLRNSIVMYSECPFGERGLANGKESKRGVEYCSNCKYFKQRIDNKISCINENDKERFKEKRLKEMIENNTHTNKRKPRAYLYHDIMLNEDEESVFIQNCSEDMRTKSREDDCGKSCSYEKIY